MSSQVSAAFKICNIIFEKKLQINSVPVSYQWSIHTSAGTGTFNLSLSGVNLLHVSFYSK